MAVPVAYYPISQGAVRLSENYKDIATDLGLGAYSATPIQGKVAVSSSALVKAMEAGRIQLQLRNGTGKQRRSVSVLCAIDKMEDAVKTVIGKNFGTSWRITSANYPRKARFY